MTTSNTSPKPKIGFIGMGQMGSHIAQRLIQGGYTLTVYDRTEEKAQEVARSGAKVAASPRELAANVNVIITCVANDHALFDVMLEPAGALAGAKAGTLCIDMSTVSPNTSRHIYEAAREKNVKMINQLSTWVKAVWARQ